MRTCLLLLPLLALACVDDAFEPEADVVAGTLCSAAGDCMQQVDPAPPPTNCTDTCHDGTWEPLCEACDPTAHGEANCTYECTVRKDHCLPAFAATCGDVIFATTNGAGSTDGVDNYSCADRTMAGRELTFELVPPHGNARMTVDVSGFHAFQPEVFVVERVGGACRGDACMHDLAREPLSFDPWEAEDTLLVVDSADDSGWFELRVSCHELAGSH